MIQNIGSFVLLSWLWANRDKTMDEAIQPEVVDTDQAAKEAAERKKLADFLARQEWERRQTAIIANRPTCRYGYSPVYSIGIYPADGFWTCAFVGI